MLRSRGFGFITFASPESVQAAMAEANHELDNKKVEVKSAHAKETGGRGRGKGYGRGYGQGYGQGMDPSMYGGKGGGQYGYGGRGGYGM